jgi:hypothetical protein
LELALISVIGGTCAENMPGGGKRKKFLRKIPDGQSGRRGPQMKSGAGLIGKRAIRGSFRVWRKNEEDFNLFGGVVRCGFDGVRGFE